MWKNEATLEEVGFSGVLAPSLLTFDPRLEGETLQSPPQDQVRGRQDLFME